MFLVNIHRKYAGPFSLFFTLTLSARMTLASIQITKI